jgi:hypothetical protein
MHSILRSLEEGSWVKTNPDIVIAIIVFLERMRETIHHL